MPDAPCGDETPVGHDDEADCELAAGHDDEWHEARRWFDRYLGPGAPAGTTEVVVRWRHR